MAKLISLFCNEWCCDCIANGRKSLCKLVVRVYDQCAGDLWLNFSFGNSELSAIEHECLWPTKYTLGSEIADYALLNTHCCSEQLTWFPLGCPLNINCTALNLSANSHYQLEQRVKGLVRTKKKLAVLLLRFVGVASSGTQWREFIKTKQFVFCWL